MNRRSFLQGSVVGAATAAAAPLSAAAASARLPSDQLRVAVVGVNGRGKSHLKGFAASPDTVVTTVCDVDLNVAAGAQKLLEEAGAPKPKVVQDIRRVLDDKEIDIVSIATPDHWHALGAIWACQAGKDVYVEKPVSHNVSEGRRVVDAARKYDRLVQAGTQSRSIPAMQDAIKFLRDGGIGKVYMAKALCYKRRKSIGRTPEMATPDGVDYNLWLGPAPERPYSRNRFHYNWHWMWDYGTTDMGNQGIHQMDIARWGIGKHELPRKIHGTGAKFVYDDDQETPNTQVSTFEYDDVLLIFEVRGLLTNDEKGVKVGNIFYGSDGYLTIGGDGWKTYLGEKGEPGPAGTEKEYGNHFQNFIDAVKKRDHTLLTADILEGHLSSALCHLGNVSYRTGRKLTFDPSWENFPGDDEANSYLTRRYRKPFVVPEAV
jgi:predicted dehydrogenase